MRFLAYFTRWELASPFLAIAGILAIGIAVSWALLRGLPRD